MFEPFPPGDAKCWDHGVQELVDTLGNICLPDEETNGEWWQIEDLLAYWENFEMSQFEEDYQWGRVDSKTKTLVLHGEVFNFVR